jgi:gentisate 1,2-dioxygenase
MTSAPFFSKPETSAEREDFYRRLGTKGVAPLWQSLGDLVLAQPRTACVPAIWHYDEIRPLLMESGELISALEADRRVLMIENPGLKGVPQITQSLYAGLQLVMPGEFTETHRHAAGALRFVIEGDGACTSVNGTKIAMHPGDFILTPSWTWHDHGNATSQPVVWMDGLDIPIVNMLDTSFAEHYPGGIQTVLTVLKNEESETPFSFPYASSRAKLDQLPGGKLHYGDGEFTMPTIDAWLQLLPPGSRTKPRRSTDATVYCVTEGHGQSHIGGATFPWGPHDIFMVPSWSAVSHEVEQEAVLFSFSDRPLQKTLGLWREEILDFQ